MDTPPSQERPLSGMANVLLQAGAAATILLFYFFVLCSISVLLVVLLVEFVLLLAAVRFGGARLVAPLIGGHGNLLLIFMRSLWLRKGAEYRVALHPQDAPDLFTMIGTVCHRARVPLPRKVYLQMGVNAYVQLKGYRRGADNTLLGMGYDLLAGLSQAEIEAVLGHEMMHAKLVQRGFKQILGKGISRAGKLSTSLANQIHADRQAKKSVLLLFVFTRCSDALTRLAVRQVAACSRQDEFEADRGAAEICGAGSIASALRKLDDLGHLASRLPLRDRIAQLESGENFGDWLARELAAPPPADAEVKAEAFDRYSTHPTLHDRLAALSIFPDQTVPESPPAIKLLADTDKVARELVETIQKELVAQEKQDSKQLDRWSRKTRSARQTNFTRFFGIFLIILGLFSIFGWFMPNVEAYAAAIFTLVTLGPGAWLFYLGGLYKEKFTFPVPDYSLIKAAGHRKLQLDKEHIEATEKELRAAAPIKGGKEKAAYFINQAGAALAQGDYVRAHIAARFCLEQEKQSVPGHLALAVAGARLNQTQQVVQALRFVQQKTGMKGDSTSWCAGWALTLLGDWVYGEIFLEQARRLKPGVPTVLALQAICQLRRGKLYSAIASARQARLLAPDNLDYTKLLIDLLLQGGFLREAYEYLQHLAQEATTDSELTLAMVKMSLTQRNFPIAEQWMALVEQNADGPEKFIKLGVLCENARHDEQAVAFFQHALTLGHYPEALFGLGRIEAHRRNKDQARAHFLSALDLHRPIGPNSSGALPLIMPVLTRLKLLQEPVLNCRAWLVNFSGAVKSTALAKTTFMVYAPNDAEARQILQPLLEAMQPGDPLPTTHWRLAPREQQPDGPVYPGIQHVVN